MIYAIQTEKLWLVKQYDRKKNFKLVSKPTKVYVGIVSPFRYQIITYTRLLSETILHTEKDIIMVTDILNEKKIKHNVIQIKRK